MNFFEIKEVGWSIAMSKFDEYEPVKSTLLTRIYYQTQEQSHAQVSPFDYFVMHEIEEDFIDSQQPS
jgi:hypothetical protein